MCQLLIISLFVGCVSVNSEPQLQFYINPSHPPPEMGMTETAVNFISFYNFFDYAVYEGLAPLKLNGPLYRFAKLLLWDISNINWLGTVVHELGHGQRAVENGWGIGYYIPYNYLPFSPWLGLRSAWTFEVWDVESDSSKSGEEERARFTVGGLEAERVAARLLRKKFYGISPVRGTDFLWAALYEQGTSFYVLKTKIGDGGDVSNWLWDMVALKTDDSIPSFGEREKLFRNIRKESCIFSLLNPPFYQSLYYTFKLLFLDSVQVKVAMFKIGKVQIMPAFSYGLTSLGTERYFEVYWRSDSLFGSGYIGHLWRISQPDAICSGVYVGNIPYDKVRFSFDLHGWTGRPWGCALETEVGIVTAKSSLLIAAGAKTKGYLQGLPYNATAWLRFGLKIIL